MQQPATADQLNELMAKLVVELCTQGLLAEQDSEALLGTLEVAPPTQAEEMATQRRSARDARLSAIERSLGAAPEIIEQGRRELGRSNELLSRQARA